MRTIQTLAALALAACSTPDASSLSPIPLLCGWRDPYLSAPEHQPTGDGCSWAQRQSETRVVVFAWPVGSEPGPCDVVDTACAVARPGERLWVSARIPDPGYSDHLFGRGCECGGM